MRAFGGETDALDGRRALAAYFRRALDRYPGLRFTPVSVSSGPRTVVIEYRAQSVHADEHTVEILQTGPDGLITHSRVYHAGA